MVASIELRSDRGTVLNARIDVDPRGVVLHSRSGTDRNRDYREALEILMAKFDAAAIPYDIYLDSAPVREIPLERRKLSFPRRGPIPDRFNALVRSMNAGTSSHGAWRRILFVAPGHSGAGLADVIQRATGALETHVISRLPASQLRLVAAEHIDRAVARLLNGEAASNFAQSVDFDVITPTGDRLAPKKVFGLALEEALKIDARPGHFSAGIGTPCFRMLEDAGYPILRKDELVSGKAVEPIDPDLAAAEGRPRLVAHLKRERNPALAAAKRRAMMEQLGHLACERCKVVPSRDLGPHGDAVIEVHHSGTQVAEMRAGHVTRLADLSCLCANCHRIVHREIAA